MELRRRLCVNCPPHKTAIGQKGTRLDKIIIYTLVYKGAFIFLPDEEAEKYKPEVVRAWEFDCAPYLGEAVIEVGRKMNAARLTNEYGRGDLDAMEIARAKFTVEVLVKSWNRRTDTGDAMPITPENIGSLPADVLRAFRLRAERGMQPTLAELDAMKLPTLPSTNSTPPVEG